MMSMWFCVGPRMEFRAFCSHAKMELVGLRVEPRRKLEINNPDKSFGCPSRNRLEVSNNA
jgi:hypothetical protein